MIFNSLNELKEYVEKAHKSVVKDLGEKKKEILQKEVKEQVQSAYSPVLYDRTNQILDNVVYEINGNTVKLILKQGSWTSVITGESVYALAVLEEGWSWGSNTGIYKESSNHIMRERRPQTHIVEKTISEVKKELPKCYKEAMRKRGVPVS